MLAESDEDRASKRSCRREDFVPHCEETHWMEDRKNSQAAMVGGDFPFDDSSTGVATDDPAAVHNAFCSGQFCEDPPPVWKCGLVGVRVGEAAHPGPSGSVDAELFD